MRYRFGKFELDTTHRVLLNDGGALPLHGKAFDLLCELVANGGDVVSKDDLLSRIWPDQYVEENNLTVQISALRKVLSGNGQLISTISGRGYSFVSPVEVLDDAGSDLVIDQRTIERIIIEHEVPAEKLLAGGSVRRWRVLAAIAVFAIATGAYFAYRYTAATRTPRVTSIAILPFVNETSDANNEYLSDGLAESVSYSLSQVPDLRVMSHGSVFRYKGKEADAKTIGSELNVNAVLTGRVTQRGDDLNISAELVSADDNTVIWGEQFSRHLADIEKIQGDIANSISSRLRFKLTGYRPRTAENSEAYRTYLQALYYWHKRGPDDIKKSIELFRSTVAIDPQFAQGYGGLAMANIVLEDNGLFSRKEIDVFREEAHFAVERALEIDPDLAEAHAVRGVIRMHDWDFTGAENSLRRAIEINPNFATAHQWYFELLSVLGRKRESRVESEKALQLDPFSRVIILNAAVQTLDEGRIDEAISKMQKLIAMEPEYGLATMFYANALEEKGMLREAIEPGCRARILFKVETAESCIKSNAEFEKALSVEGPPGYWKKMIERWSHPDSDGGRGNSFTAASYFWLGDRDKGFEYLERAFANHEPEVIYIKVDAPFTFVTDDPRHASLLKRIGLPE